MQNVQHANFAIFFSSYFFFFLRYYTVTFIIVAVENNCLVFAADVLVLPDWNIVKDFVNGNALRYERWWHVYTVQFCYVSTFDRKTTFNLCWFNLQMDNVNANDEITLGILKDCSEFGQRYFVKWERFLFFNLGNLGIWFLN